VLHGPHPTRGPWVGGPSCSLILAILFRCVNLLALNVCKVTVPPTNAGVS
jgi:hypothetical protein